MLSYRAKSYHYARQAILTNRETSIRFYCIFYSIKVTSTKDPTYTFILSENQITDTKFEYLNAKKSYAKIGV